MNRRTFIKTLMLMAASAPLAAQDWELVGGKIIPYGANPDDCEAERIPEFMAESRDAAVVESSPRVVEIDSPSATEAAYGNISVSDGAPLGELKLYIPKSRRGKRVNVDIGDDIAISEAFRDYHTGKEADIPMELRELVLGIQDSVGGKRIEILSAYRSPKTNRALRRRTGGVAKNSYHLKGMAVDIRVTGVSVERLARIANENGAGGIGIYRNHGFIHIDIGPRRRWRG